MLVNHQSGRKRDVEKDRTDESGTQLALRAIAFPDLRTPDPERCDREITGFLGRVAGR